MTGSMTVKCCIATVSLHPILTALPQTRPRGHFGGKMYARTDALKYSCPECNNKMAIVNLENLFHVGASSRHSILGARRDSFLAA